jgi:hypothetical protein
MAKPTPVDPAAPDPIAPALKGPGDSPQVTDENTDPEENPQSATVQGVMTIYEIDTMGGAVPGDLFDGGALAGRLSSEGEASEEE